MANLKFLKRELQRIEGAITRSSLTKKKLIGSLHASRQESAANLIQYLALRSIDVRSIQDDLHQAGLSSMASSESHILSQIQAIRQRLGAEIAEAKISNCDYFAAQQLINHQTTELFGYKKDPAIPHIMVTLDNSFEDDVILIKKLLEAGMNIARINCAHGNEKNWESLIASVRQASDKTGLACKIYMDIAGPKMRIEILGKQKKKGKIRISLGQHILLLENDEKVNGDEDALSCHEKGIIDTLKPGERIIMDDGKFEGIVTKKKKKLYLKITRISSKKPFLKQDKGLNLPDTKLNLPALMEADLKAIPFIAAHADMVGCSFLRNAEDLKLIKDAFRRQNRIPKLILKIETPESVINLPALLLESMSEECFGVMIARGDLAVEIGFERLSEIQDEILWICEAAHVPVVWATQVLETFNKSGVATRSEVTDAAHAAKAECVMLNKGPFIVETIHTLKEILARSGGHRHKKRYTMRPLHIATHFFDPSLKSKAGTKN